MSSEELKTHLLTDLTGRFLIPNNSPFYYDVDPELGASVSRSYNRAIGRLLTRYPDRFIGIATAPLQNTDLAIREMEYAVTELGLSAVILYQNINGRDLDGEFLCPFYERAERLGVPLLIYGVDSGPLLGVERYARFNLDVCLGFPTSWRGSPKRIKITFLGSPLSSFSCRGRNPASNSPEREEKSYEFVGKNICEWSNKTDI